MKIFFKGLVLIFLLSTTSCGAQKSMVSDVMTKRIEALDSGLYVVINSTRGEVLAKLFYDETPLTVANFVALAEGRINTDVKDGRYYDGIIFHRVISNFMIQTGDPRGNGTGGPGYQFPDEIVAGLNFDRAGLLAMANAGAGTNGSQFFITHTATPHLNGKHTIFGEVINNDDQKVVNAIAQKDVMNSVIIIAKGVEAESFLATSEVDGKVNPLLLAKIEEARMASFNLQNINNIAKVNQMLPTHQISPKGVYFLTTKEGSGAKVLAEQTVSIHYEGKLLTDGSVFDSSYQRGEPISFPAGVGYVIPGWDEMVLDMKTGEKRLVVIPSHLGYGATGAGGVIPPDAWLVFDMELIDIK